MFFRTSLVLCLLLLSTLTIHTQADTPSSSGLPFANGFVFDVPMSGIQPGTAPYDLARIDTQPIAHPITVQGQHFVIQGTDQSVRFWGTNLCLSACFPPHDVAERVANRMAGLGINIVRLHHMDGRRYPGGIWDRNAKLATDKSYFDVDPTQNFEHRQFDEEALERLDYLVAQLKQHGIRVNLNLKVSREYGTADGFAPSSENQMVPRRGRGFDLYYQPCIDAQKRYARMLLGHVNRYTGLSYAKDPVVAVIEINNENGLVYGWNLGMFDRLPQPYQQALDQRWTQWLSQRYVTTAKLTKAWGQSGDQQNDADLLANAKVKSTLRTVSGSKATIDKGNVAGEIESVDMNRDLTRITVAKANGNPWRVCYLWTGIQFQANRFYMMRIALRANTDKRITLSVRENKDSKKAIGSSHNLNVTTEFKTFEIPIQTPEKLDSDSSQILLELGYDGLVMDVGQVSLQADVPIGLAKGEGIDAGQQVPWLTRIKLAARNEAYKRDAMDFLRETEINYWRDFKQYLKNNLGATAAITGTAAGHTTPQIAAASVDFVDTHRYWGGPRFERARYNRNNWTLKHVAMASQPEISTIARMSPRRVFGMPFTITEYNHPQPNDYAADGFPILAVYGSYQDWQGVFQFAYSHSAETIEQHGLTASFFDLTGNPMQLALMPACSSIFRHQSVPMAQNQQAGYVPVDVQLQKQLIRGFPHDVEAVAYDGGIKPGAWMTSAIGLAADPAQLQRLNISTPNARQSVQWTCNDQTKGRIVFKATTAAGLIGFVQNHELDLDWLKLNTGNTSLDGFAVVLLNAVDQQPLGSPGRYLLTAVTRCANRNMGWNEDRSCFGTKWGDLPTMVEAVPLQLQCQKSLQIYPLNPDGTRRDPITPVTRQDVRHVDLNVSFKTLWYELVIP
jgi:hypothetical protein